MSSPCINGAGIVPGGAVSRLRHRPWSRFGSESPVPRGKRATTERRWPGAKLDTLSPRLDGRMGPDLPPKHAYPYCKVKIVTPFLQADQLQPWRHPIAYLTYMWSGRKAEGRRTSQGDGSGDRWSVSGFGKVIGRASGSL